MTGCVRKIALTPCQIAAPRKAILHTLRSYVNKIGQHHHGVDHKRVARLRDVRRLAQSLDIFRHEAKTTVFCFKRNAMRL
jgi:hypothetical protein